MPDYRAIATQKARQYHLPVPVFLAQIGQESGWNPAAHSSAGADGIAQFIPSTARAYGVNTRDPISSLDGAARLDADLLHKYGTIQRALSAYNSGKPDAYLNPGFAGGQTSNYVKDILAHAGGVPSAGGPTPHGSAGPAMLTAGMSAPGVPPAGASPFVQGLLAQTAQILGTSPLPLPTGHIAAPAASSAGPLPLTAPPTATGKLVLPVRGDIDREAPSFLAALTQAAKARGAVAIVATSGERSPEHNAQVGGATHSNHLPDPQGYGHAIDGYAVLRDGTKVPLGQFLKPNAASFGLRSGATFNWNGAPDLVHVDDFRNGGR